MRKIEVGTLKLNSAVRKNIKTVLDTQRLSYGPFTKELETKFSAIHGAKFGIASNSGTSSLQVALQALKEIHNWQDGDEVIVPAITFIASSNIVLHNRMMPVFVDVDPIHYELEPSKIEAAITNKTRAIMPVHLFGQPCDMKPIREIADKYKLLIIEDSCETMFAKYDNQYVGSLGDIGCFSLYVAHLLVTGVGGLSLTSNPDYAIKMRSLVNHGRDSIYLSIDDDNNVDNAKLQEIIAKRFSFVSVGHSFRITELEAAIGVAQLNDWEKMIDKRRKNAKKITKILKPLEQHLQLPMIRNGNEHSFMMYPILLKDKNKQDVVNYLELNGIETRDMMPLINQPIYKKIFNLNEDDFPVAKNINRNGFYIGCHQNIGKEDIAWIGEVFSKAMEE